MIQLVTISSYTLSAYRTMIYSAKVSPAKDISVALGNLLSSSNSARRPIGRCLKNHSMCSHQNVNISYIHSAASPIMVCYPRSVYEVDPLPLLHTPPV